MGVPTPQCLKTQPSKVRRVGGRDMVIFRKSPRAQTNTGAGSTGAGDHNGISLRVSHGLVLTQRPDKHTQNSHCSVSRRHWRRRGSAVGASTAPSSRGSYRQLYTCLCVFGLHFFGSRNSHCSPAASSNSGSASQAQSTAPAGKTDLARFDLLSESPSATRTTRPVDQIMCGWFVSLSVYFQST